MTLDPVQVRALGALIEKEITTPDGYPLSLNALLNACNQKSSRDPIMDLDEEAVRFALRRLEDAGLVRLSRESRVPKFEHQARTVFNLRRDETAILCLLMLRGPQTPGELRSRSDRMYAFDDLQAIENTLNRLASRPPQPGHADENEAAPLAVLLPRQPGSREARWMHLLGGPPDLAELAAPSARTTESSGSRMEDRISALETEVASLRDTIARLEHTLENVKHRPE